MNKFTGLHEPIIPVLRVLLQELAPDAGEFVLDLASGGGEKTPLLRETLGNKHFFALDTNQAALVEARQHAVVVVGDAHKLPLRDASLDLIVCIAALGLFATPQLALREMHRVLRSGGQALVVTAEQRWARVTWWPPELANLLSSLPPAHADHADIQRIPITAGFTNVSSYAIPLMASQTPIAAALLLHDWSFLEPLAANMLSDVREACERANSCAEIELCDMCLAVRAHKP